LPGKNLLPFAESTLLHHKIRQLQETPEITQILVSSDSEEMIDVALSLGCEIDRRPEKYADESRPFSEFIDYISSKVLTKDLLWACVTSPMVGPALYSQSIRQFPALLDSGYDSIVSVLPVRQYLFDEKGPVNFGTKETHKNSQEMDLAHLYTAGLILSPTVDVRSWSFIFGPNPFRLELSQANSVDIDTYEDYVIAKALFAEFGNQL
jgi:N-acylneuraminate cytidylyltransferase